MTYDELVLKLANVPNREISISMPEEREMLAAHNDYVKAEAERYRLMGEKTNQTFAIAIAGTLKSLDGVTMFGTRITVE